MKIMFITKEDFIKSEINEHGFDYVEAQFIMGFEPVLVNGIWVWRQLSRTSGFCALTTSTVS